MGDNFEFYTPSESDEEEEYEVELEEIETDRMHAIAFFIVVFCCGFCMLLFTWTLFDPSSSLPFDFEQKSVNNDSKWDEIYKLGDTLVKLKYMEAASQPDVYQNADTEKTYTAAKHLNESLIRIVLRVRRDAEEQDEGQYPKLLRIPQIPQTASQPGVYQNADTEKTPTAAEHLNKTLIRIVLRLRRDAEEQDEGQYPKMLRIPRSTRNETEEDLHVEPIENNSSACKVPKGGLKTAEILCNAFSKIKICKSYCAYGNTYREGIVRTHFCSYQYDVWSKPFEECKPFVDCNARLISPGTLQCVDNEVNERPSCLIWCKIYEDKSEVKNTTYVCKSDGTWKPPLPFCADLSGMQLVPAPDVTEHGNISFPKYEKEKVPRYLPRYKTWK